MDEKQRPIHHIWNMEFGPPSFWERIVLMFCELESAENEIGTVYYKAFLDRLYIYRREWKGPVALPPPVMQDGGMNTPWLN